MSDVVISVENLSKAYHLGQIGTGTLTNDLKVWWNKARGKPNPMLRIDETDHGNRDDEDLWALRDISFSVAQGEVLGIIGRNGAGKSTILKILSRVTAPTSGKIKVKGRIASLLEVGTGFHPDLTGRENIYLNGAILGMSHKEIDRKLDEIVDFAEIEKFIDTPVKRYSSGMYVRLAFAVAAHMEPEILVVDEVLAVGDARFQEKCLSKMKNVSVNNGRTVIFVSHNMNAIKQLCSRTILLNSGQIEFSGSTNSVIDKYLRFDNASSHYVITCKDTQPGIRSIKFLNEEGADADALRTGKTYVVDFVVFSPVSMPSVGIEFGLTNHFGNRVIFSNSYYIFGLSSGLHEGNNVFKCTIPNLPLLAGKYALDIALYDEMALHRRLQYESNIGIVEVIENDVFKTGRAISPEWGEIFFPHHWSKPQ